MASRPAEQIHDRISKSSASGIINLFSKEMINGMRRRRILIASAIFVCSAALFGLLHTQQYLAVDGAVRALAVY